MQRRELEPAAETRCILIWNVRDLAMPAEEMQHPTLLPS
jgi:hypothetical protein